MLAEWGEVLRFALTSVAECAVNLIFETDTSITVVAAQSNFSIWAVG